MLCYLVRYQVCESDSVKGFDNCFLPTRSGFVNRFSLYQTESWWPSSYTQSTCRFWLSEHIA